MPAGGWAWRSAIQAPHYQTDRDVGAASVGEGLLAAYAVTRDARYLRAAEAAGDFLLGVAEPDAGGLRWPDWADPDGRVRPRTSRASTTARPGSATTSGSLSSVTHSRAFAPLRSVECAGSSRRRRDGPARRPRAPGAGRTTRPGASPTTASAWARRGSCSRSTRSPTPPATARCRTYARAGAARLRALTANGTARCRRSDGRDARDRLPERLGRRGVHVPRALRARSRSGRSRDGTRLLGWVNDQAVARRRGGRQLAARRTTRRPAARASSSAPPASPGSTCGPPRRPATAPTARSRAGPASGCAASPPRRRVGRAARRPRHSGSRRARQRRGGDRLGPRGPRPRRLDPACRIGPPRGRRLPDCTRGRARRARDALVREPDWRAPRLPAEPSWHWGSAGIAAFAARLAGWSGQAPGGQRRGELLTVADMIRRP